jgi:hypothetical protein
MIDHWSQRIAGDVDGLECSLLSAELRVRSCGGGIRCHGAKDDLLGTGGERGPTWFLLFFG